MPILLPQSKKCPSSNTLQYIFLESMLTRVGGVELHAVDARQRPRSEVDQVQRVAHHARYYLLKSGYKIPSTTCSTAPSAQHKSISNTKARLGGDGSVSNHTA